MKSTRVGMVINKLKVGNQDILETVCRSGLDILGTVPDDERITSYDATGKPLLELPDDFPKIKAVEEILESMGRSNDANPQ